MVSTDERTADVGLVCVLASFAMLVAALLFVAVRLGHGGSSRAVVGLATLAIAGSSAALAAGRRAVAIVLGAAFLAAVVVLWSRAAVGVLHIVTGVHAVHVLVGLAGLTTSGRRWRTYWHSVGVAWLVLALALL